MEVPVAPFFFVLLPSGRVTGGHNMKMVHLDTSPEIGI